MLWVDTAISSQTLTITPPPPPSWLHKSLTAPGHGHCCKRLISWWKVPGTLLKTQTLPCGRNRGCQERDGGEQRNRAGLWENSSSYWFSYVTMASGEGGSIWGNGRGVGEPVVGRFSAVVAVVIRPAWWRGRVGLVVIFAERCGIVGGGVDVCLLKRSWIEIGPFIWQQVVLVQCLEWQQRKFKELKKTLSTVTK